MKRILAVFLTLAMALNIAPVAAFAAADSDAASIVAVEETDETSSPQLDEETARAIASDPLLQAAYAQTEQEQTGQAEVDTSNMSVSATNSFGQLLVNGLGMDGENGSDLSSESRVIEITMNGSTAMVKYIVKKDANLVVGIYTDDSEQEMIASGTVAVQATPDNTGQHGKQYSRSSVEWRNTGTLYCERFPSGQGRSCTTLQGVHKCVLHRKRGRAGGCYDR